MRKGVQIEKEISNKTSCKEVKNNPEGYVTAVKKIQRETY